MSTRIINFMAINQTQKQSDLEKRLRILRQQVYGKQTNQQLSELQERKLPIPKYQLAGLSDKHQSNISISSEITYIRQDLLKIFLLTSIALIAQFILFYLLQNHILSLNLF
jgi:hypothetical protein